MEDFKKFIIKYRGAIIGAIISILILCTRLYELILGVVLIGLGMIIGNYIQNNKNSVKEKVKKFIDKL